MNHFFLSNISFWLLKKKELFYKTFVRLFIKSNYFLLFLNYKLFLAEIFSLWDGIGVGCCFNDDM